MNTANQEELKVKFCDLCNCVHGVNSATCLKPMFEMLEKASDEDLARFENELDEQAFGGES